MTDKEISEPFTDEFIEAIDHFLADVNKLAILGIGNEDNGDDAVGLHILKLLQKEVLPTWVKNFYCERVPEAKLEYRQNSSDIDKYKKENLEYLHFFLHALGVQLEGSGDSSGLKE